MQKTIPSYQLVFDTFHQFLVRNQTTVMLLFKNILASFNKWFTVLIIICKFLVSRNRKKRENVCTHHEHLAVENRKVLARFSELWVSRDDWATDLGTDRIGNFTSTIVKIIFYLLEHLFIGYFDKSFVVRQITLIKENDSQTVLVADGTFTRTISEKLPF